MIRWITNEIGTAPWGLKDIPSETHILDVRDLVDKAGNMTETVKLKIDEGVGHLRKGKKLVICCDYGISRSNAIGAGVLAIHKNINLDDAIKQIITKTGEKAIKLEVLSEVRRALGDFSKKTSVSPKKIQNLLITGASGFVGSSLVNHLNPRNKVVTPSHKEIDLVCDTVALDRLAREEDIDTIIHLASPRVYTSNESLGLNLIMLKNVLDVCAENSLHLVYISGWVIYSGYEERELKANETLLPRPGGTYGQTKFLCETLIERYTKHHGIFNTIIRSSPVYGPRSDRPKFIWNFLEKAIRNEDIITHKYLNGYPILDLLHVDDLSRAITTATHRRTKGVINVGSGIGTSTRDIAKLIINITNSRSKIRHIEIEKCSSNIIMEIGYASKVLGWQPTIALAAGLKTISKKVLLNH